MIAILPRRPPASAASRQTRSSYCCHGRRTATIERCAETFQTLPVELHLGPEEVLHKFDDAKLSTLGPVITLQLTRRPLSRFEILQKRLFDLVVAAAALIVTTPLLLLVAALIRIDSPGPIFFVQRRYGFNQQPFPIIKFRTMRTFDDGGQQQPGTIRA